MPKATLKLPDGTQVSIDGSSEEIARLMSLYASATTHEPNKKGPARGATGSQKGKTKSASARQGPKTYIRELKDAGFFKDKRTLPDVQKKLEEHGHIYAQNSLSTPILRLVRDKELRRLKEDSVWVYVNN